MKLTNLVLLYVSFFLVVIMAISNSYIINLKGATVDAERFLELGIGWASTGYFKLAVDAEFFVQLIGVLIRLGLGEFGITLIGILLYYITIAPFMGRLTLSIKKPSTIAVFFLLAFAPSMLFRIAALLREPYMVFFLTFGLLLLSDWLLSRKLNKLVLGIACCVISAFFHKATLALMPLILVMLMVCSFKISLRSVIFIITSIPLFSYLLFEAFSFLQGLRGSQALEVLLTGDTSLADQIVSRKSTREFRTTYDYGADWNSLVGILTSIFKANIYYYGKPFITDINSLSDVIAFIENFLRLMVLYTVIAKLYTSRFDNRQYLFLFGCYLLFNIIWALGTSNYGTGSRHHMTSLPILGLLYYLVFNENKKVSS